MKTRNLIVCISTALLAALTGCVAADAEEADEDACPTCFEEAELKRCKRGRTCDAGTDSAATDSGAPPPPNADSGAPPPPDASAPPPAGRAGPGIKPDATNTGVPPGVALTVIDGDVTVTTDDTVLDAKDIRGFLTIRANRVRLSRSVVRGRAATSNASVIRVASGTGVVLEDSEVAVAAPSAWIDGVSGSGFVARRMNIHGGVDGMKIRSNSTVEYSFIHGMISFASDPNQGGGRTHNDAIQILSGTGIRVIGNQLVVARNQNAAIQVTQDFGTVGDLRIETNWVDGGGCTFNFSHNGGTSLSVGTTNNRFGRNSYYNCPILKSTRTTLSTSGDVWDDTGTAVPIQTHD